MGRTTDLRREIKQRINPLMAEKGFICDMRQAPQFVTFRKRAPEAVYVFDIQWEKYGAPRFIINFGKCGAAGTICHGERVDPENVFPSHTPLFGRLGPSRASSTSGWFRQDRPLINRIPTWSRYYPAEDVVTNLVTLFREVEEFWANGKMGPHVRLLPAPEEWVKDVV